MPYCGSAPTPGEWLGHWNFDPLLLAGLAVAMFLWNRFAGAGAPAGRQRLVVAVGLLLLLFVSPFCALTSALFSARVAHHVLLAAAVAPLIAMSTRRFHASLPFWTAVQALIFWAWHAPSLYSTALSSDAVYWLMQVSLLASAVLFWIAVRSANEVSAVAALLVSMVQMGLLGALITFAGSALYAPHWLTTQPWGFSPLEDQQLAGLIMWAPAAGVYLAAALAIAGRWLALERSAPAR
jgi:putative membrane protein